MRQDSNQHKDLTPHSTKNLKAFGLRVFYMLLIFFISTQSGTRPTLGYLAIFLSSGRVPHSQTLNVRRLSKISIRKTFNTWIKLYSLSRSPSQTISSDTTY